MGCPVGTEGQLVLSSEGGTSWPRSGQTAGCLVPTMPFKLLTKVRWFHEILPNEPQDCAFKDSELLLDSVGSMNPRT